MLDNFPSFLFYCYHYSYSWILQRGVIEFVLDIEIFFVLIQNTISQYSRQKLGLLIHSTLSKSWIEGKRIKLFVVFVVAMCQRWQGPFASFIYLFVTHWHIFQIYFMINWYSTWYILSIYIFYELVIIFYICYEFKLMMFWERR